jgi:O-antigen/teichoic acid export membrane protein
MNLIKDLISDDRLKRIAGYNLYYIVAVIILYGTDKLIINPFLVRNLLKAEFGVFLIIMTICNVLITALSGGINAVIIREHAKVKNKINLYNVGISLTLTLSSTIIVILLFLFPFVAKILNLENYNTFLYPLMIYTIFLSLRETYITFRRIDLQFKFVSIQNIILGFLYLMIIPLFYLLDRNGIGSGYLLASLISLIIVSNKRTFPKFHLFIKEVQILKIFLKYGPFFMMGSFFTLLMRLVDRFFIAYYINTEQVTVYFTAASTIAILTFPFSQIGSILLPIISNKKKISEFKKSDIKKLLILSFLTGFVILSSGLLFGELIITILYGAQFYNLSKYCFIILLISFSIQSLIQYSKHFIDVFLNPIINLYSVLFALVINITGNYFLIPKLGIVGAAISTGSSVIVYSFIWFFIFMKKVYIKTS